MDRIRSNACITIRPRPMVNSGKAVKISFEQEYSIGDNSRTVDPEYIVFHKDSLKPTTTDLANNLACVYNRLNLFSKVSLKNYKSISEKQKELESRVQNCQEKLESCEELLRKTQSETRKSLQQISTEIQQSKPLTKREVLNLVQEIAEQPNQEAHHRMSLANQKATTEYQEAIQATEDLESPAVGFAKTSDYKGGLTNQVNAVIKQNNTLLYLATKQSQKLVSLEEKFSQAKRKFIRLKEMKFSHADLRLQ
ncbi:Orf y [Tanacetum coccineum]